MTRIHAITALVAFLVIALLVPVWWHETGAWFYVSGFAISASGAALLWVYLDLKGQTVGGENVHVVSWLDRLTCRVFDHAWVAHASTGRLSSCIRCVKQHPNAGPEAEPRLIVDERNADEQPKPERNA